jgi:hypothetical protein
MAKTSWLLATFGEVGSMSTSMWDIEKCPLRNDAVFPPPSGEKDDARPPNHPVSPKLDKSPV